MVRLRTLTIFELRRRVDTTGSKCGFLILATLTIAATVGAALLGAGQHRVVLSEVISLAALPLALGGPVMGVVFGTADATFHGDRAEILAGARRGSILIARLLACVAMTTALIITTSISAIVASAAVAMWNGVPMHAGALLDAIWGVCVLGGTSALFGLAVGALVRSIAVGVVVVTGVVLVIDSALVAAPPWTEVLRFSSFQDALLGRGDLAPALCAFGLWIATPAMGAVLRTRRGES
jgi:hypothetical protein